MTAFDGRLYDGAQARARAVTARFLPGERRLRVESDGEVLAQLPFDAIRIEPPLGRTPRRIRLEGAAFVEVEDSPAFRAVEKEVAPRSWMHLVSLAESRKSAILGSIAGLAVVLFALLKFGLPLAADSVASKLPPDVLASISDTTLRTLDRTMLEPSKVPEARQREIREGFARVASKVPGLPEWRIEFRGGYPGPNAFALPSGTIVVTDDMVDFVASDRELYAVLAHELGHVHYRHGMRLVLQHAGVTLLVSFFLGDVSSLLTTAGALPVVLVESGYSRKFETEADDYAVRFCRESGIGVECFATLFWRMKKKSAELPAWFSSHPNLDQRISRIRQEETAAP